MSDYVPIKDSLLEPDKLALKRAWDMEWKAESDRRATEFYARKRAGQTTAGEEQDFLTEDAALWKAEEQRRINAGLYQPVEKAKLQVSLAILQAEVTALETKIKAME